MINLHIIQIIDLFISSIKITHSIFLKFNLECSYKCIECKDNKHNCLSCSDSNRLLNIGCECRAGYIDDGVNALCF